MRGIFLDFGTVSNGDLNTSPLDQALDAAEYRQATDPEDLARCLHGRNVALANKIRFDSATLQSAGALRLICLSATGSDNVDLEAARARNIAVCNIRDYCTAAVVQHVFALLLALTQHLPGYRAALREGAWSEAGKFCMLRYPVRELSGKTLGIVGYGTLGRGVARAAEAFGLQVLIAARPGVAPAADRVAFGEVLNRADVLSLHCPLTEETRGLIGAPELAAMRPGAVLINTARGALVDGAALVAALRSGAIAGAGIDVLPVEPPPADDPLLVADLPNLIVTPHIAWATREARQRALEEMAENVSAFRRGEDRNRLA